MSTGYWFLLGGAQGLLAKPEAAFSAVSAGRNAVFTDESTDPNQLGEIVAWAWDFGDGATSALQNPTHVFPGYGTFEVSLVVTDETGLDSEPALLEVEITRASPLQILELETHFARVLELVTWI